MRHLLVLVLLPVLLLAACGGGGGNSSGSSGSSGSGGSGGGSGSSAPSAPANTVALTVDGGPPELRSGSMGKIFPNLAYVSVTLCVPGTSQCQTLDHVEIDTGSTGFRVVSAALSSTMLAALPAQTNSSTGLPVSECQEFGDGYTFGPVVTVDLKIGSETAASLPIQVIGGGSAAAPSDCVSDAMGQPALESVADLGANAILGLAVVVQDCGAGCANAAVAHHYYTCSSGSNGTCANSAEPVAQQVSNPVASFAADNNGVAVQLEAIGDAGAPTATGTLFFGVGTQSNNTPGSSAVVLTADATGTLTTAYNGQTFPKSVLDSGSNGFFFTDSSITQCGTTGLAPSNFFCPTSTLSLTATNTGNNPDGTAGSSPSSTVSFMIANANTVLGANPQPTAADNVGGDLGNKALDETFLFGLPFFYGRTVYFVMDGASTAQGLGPYYSY